MKNPPYVLLRDGDVMAYCDNLVHGSTLAYALRKLDPRQSIGLWDAEYRECQYAPTAKRPDFLPR